MPIPIEPVRVKLCGLTTLVDALGCAEAGADWIGLNFHPASPRYIAPAVAAEIVSALPATCRAVGLFVDRTPDEIAAIADRVGLSIVQLHGSEPVEDLVALSRFFLIRAFRLGKESALKAMSAYLEHAETLGRSPDSVLIDGYAAGLAGGTGQSIAADLLDALPPLPRLILAGGLTPENVAERVGRVRPWMVDVASGVEASPGRKDPARVAAFLRAAKNGHGR